MSLPQVVFIIVSAVVLGGGTCLVALSFLGVAARDMYALIKGLLVSYGTTVAYGGLAHAVLTAPLGWGTGTNTGPARYAFDAPESFVSIENYYAKCAFELGIAGLLVVVCLFVWVVVRGWTVTARAAPGFPRACAAGLLAYLMVMFAGSFKGMMIDRDPANAYVWLFAGLLFGIGRLRPDTEAAAARAPAGREPGRP